MMHPDKYYRDTVSALEDIEKRLSQSNVCLDLEFTSKQIEHPTSLQVPDVAVAVISGVLGGLLPSNETIANIFCDWHKDASVCSPKKLFGNLFHHYGDHIDMYPTAAGPKFVTRKYSQHSAKHGAAFCHRLFFGHDVFSKGPDNPFRILVGQYGWTRGCIQVGRHLVADTFSKAGLPLPFHSYLDHTKDGQLTNYLLTWTKYLTGGNAAEINQYFGRLFSLRAQDIIAQGITWGICKAYLALAHIEDPMRACQTRLLAYSTAFFTNFGKGMLITGGVPYVNWAALVMLVKELVQYWILSKHASGELERLMRELEDETAHLIAEGELIVQDVEMTGLDLPTYSSQEDYLGEVGKHYVQSERLWTRIADIVEESEHDY